MKKMKRVLVGLMALLNCLSVVGCSSPVQSTTDGTKSQIKVSVWQGGYRKNWADNWAAKFEEAYAGVSLEEGEAAIQQEIEKIQHDGVTEREVNKVINRFEAEHLVSNLNYTDKAANLAYHELIGRAEDINTEVDKYKRLTSDDIKEVACRYLQENNCTTLYYRATTQ
jgi:predicted Zn-dependent peptidase